MSEDVYEFTPSVKIPVLQFGLIAGIGLFFLALIYSDSVLELGQQLEQLLLAVIGFFIGILLLRILVRIFVLRKTKYVVGPDGLRREYALLYRKYAREVPIEQLRGIEFSQNRLEMFFGFGTIAVLTAGTNQSLGFLEFEHINAPRDVREKIRRLLGSATGGRTSQPTRTNATAAADGPTAGSIDASSPSADTASGTETETETETRKLDG